MIDEELRRMENERQRELLTGGRRHPELEEALEADAEKEAEEEETEDDGEGAESETSHKGGRNKQRKRGKGNPRKKKNSPRKGGKTEVKRVRLNPRRRLSQAPRIPLRQVTHSSQEPRHWRQCRRWRPRSLLRG